jgi:hypothetical protein
MKDESEPITDDEWLLRRVRVEAFTQKRPDQPLSPNAFEPRVKGRDIDTTGISLYRLSCLREPTDVLVTVPLEKRDQVGIVRVSVQTLKRLGLTVRSEPDARVAGHVCITELNATDYAADKSKFTAVKEALAAEANQTENIVRYPPAATAPSGEPPPPSPPVPAGC